MSTNYRRTAVVLSVWLLTAGVGWSAEPAAHGFGFDPALTGGVQPQGQAAPNQALAIETGKGNGDVRLSTNTPISPYVEAVGGPTPTADELRLLPETFRQNPLERYQLGAGIGIAVDDNASLSLGYRVHQPLSLLDDTRQASNPLRDDLRIFFDIKLPFD
jgi:hypothetical protein